MTSTRFELKDDFSSLDVRLCPESLLERVRTTMLPLTFQPFHIRGSKGQEDHLLAALRDTAADPRQCSSGWLGDFSLEQMNLLENLFEPYGEVPWDDLIDPLWTDLLSHVDEAWLALDPGFMCPDEERLPLACLPGPTQSPPLLDYVDAAPYEQNLPPAPLSLPPASASILSTWAMRAGGDEPHGISPALKLRLQRSPSAAAAPVFLHTYPVYTTAWPILSSTRSFYAHSSLYAPLSILSTCLFRRTPCRLSTFLCRLR